tara:strand:- start:5273 stop:5386 length:114 start_codon:yes stop_codon:yes gene_type:complete
LKIKASGKLESLSWKAGKLESWKKLNWITWKSKKTWN